jgi:hypothetical protein
MIENINDVNLIIDDINISGVVDHNEIKIWYKIMRTGKDPDGEDYVKYNIEDINVIFVFQCMFIVQ